MRYVFKGRLCGYLCDECSEPLSGVTVRLYRAGKGPEVITHAVASAKDTFAILSADQVKAKQDRLVAELSADAAGDFTAELGEQDGYAGEALEIDVYCGTVPGRRPTPPPPRPIQFSVTTVQPIWRRTEAQAIAVWQHCLSARYWCGVRARMDAWVICGKIEDCDDKLPAVGVKVSAFDVDWLQADALGTATTDASGRFRINYITADFRKDVLGWNVELFGGPDLYFKVETPSGTVLLAEPASRGRAPDRENVGPCACVRLCVKDVPPVEHAWFTRVGDFSINADIDLATGLTRWAVPSGFAGAHGGPDFGFFSTLKLVGDCPTWYPGTGLPMRYRFRYESPTSGGPQSLTSAHLPAGGFPIGNRPIPWDYGIGPTTAPQTIWVVPGGPTTPAPPPPVPVGPTSQPVPPAIIGPDADGWITIPAGATNGGFSGNLFSFVSGTVVPGGVAPANGAGNPVASPRSGTPLRLVFEAEPTTGATGLTPTLSNALARIYINNWDAVIELAVSQLDGPGGTSCSDITTALDIRYTTDHELMNAWNVGLSSPGGVPSPLSPVLPSGPTPGHLRGDNGTVSYNVTGWNPCSYRVALATSRKLTDGELENTGQYIDIPFCKS